MSFELLRKLFKLKLDRLKIGIDLDGIGQIDGIGKELSNFLIQIRYLHRIN